MATPQYDRIATQYDGVENIPGQQVPVHGMAPYAAAVKGKTVVDLACGTGHFTRWAMEKGALSVIGIDISPGQIKVASQAYTFGGKIQYYAQDCSTPLVDQDGKALVPEPVDVVIAAWLLNYAPNEETQLGMWKNISACLKPGGRFLALIPDLDADLTDAPYDPRYGMDAQKLEDVNVGKPDQGAKLRRYVYVQPPFYFDMYQLNRGVYERGAKAAGLVDVHFERNIKLPTEGRPEGYWDVYHARPQVEVMTATKA